jgi:GNAT superfamily N-acetyltransferase
MPSDLCISVTAQASKEDFQTIWDGLDAYNQQFAPPNGQEPLHVFLRRADQTLAGGLLGGTYWGWLYVEILWLAADVHRMGYGSQLLAAAEQEALRRGCRHAHLDTFTFQAVGFYEKHGYRVFGALEDLPPGFTRYYLRKDLT